MLEPAPLSDKRPLPPPLDFPYPPCSICGEECLLESGFYCPMCGASWPTTGAPEGDWEEPAAERCPSTIRPWVSNRFYPSLQGLVYRCVLDVGHTEAERGAERHRHPDYSDGWTGDEEVGPTC